LYKKLFFTAFIFRNNGHCNQKKTPKILHIEITVLEKNDKISQKNILEKQRLENGNELKTRL
jgi:hypothetical protein